MLYSCGTSFPLCGQYSAQMNRSSYKTVFSSGTSRFLGGGKWKYFYLLQMSYALLVVVLFLEEYLDFLFLGIT